MGPQLDFFDCNVCFGLPMKRPAAPLGVPPATASLLLEEMDRAGVGRALVWHTAQRDTFAGTGNDLLSRAIAGCDRLAGCWAILPPQTGELGDAGAFFARAAAAGIKAFRAFPDLHRFLLRRETVGELLDRMAAARTPLVLRVEDVGWECVYNLLVSTPALTVILSGMGCWNNDRYFRPLLERYGNVYVETSGHITDGGIEAFVQSYGGGRLLFGSDFPRSYFGSMMLAIAHAQIPDAEKQAIAGGNLFRLLSEAKP